LSSMEEKAILSFWKSNERKRFGEIKRELNKKLPQGYDQRQVARYLERLVKKGLLYKYKDEKGPYYVPAEAPHVREYTLSSHFDKIRSYSLDKGWFTEGDAGALSLARVGFYGIPRTDQMTHLELHMLGEIAARLRQAFMDYDILRNTFASRLASGLKKIKHSEIYDGLFYDFLFDLMAMHGKAHMNMFEGIELAGLCCMIPEYMEFMEKMRRKYGGIHEISEYELTKALGLLEIDAPNVSRTPDATKFDAESYDPDMVAVIVTTSPSTIVEYGMHPENVIKKFWTKADGTEFSSNAIREVLRKERKGIDYFREQESQGISIGYFCFGLKDLAEGFTMLSDPKGFDSLKIRLSRDVVARLRRWDWLIDKIGQKGIDDFVKLVRLRDKLGRLPVGSAVRH
jgi:predicted transcriptional regulator